ncbi:MAG: diguanylate cyclase [candidate division FCPU426 bacterium]
MFAMLLKQCAVKLESKPKEPLRQSSEIRTSSVLDYFHKEPKTLIVVLALMAVVLLGWMRVLTGPELALSLFYLVPVCVVTWRVGRWAGFIFAGLSALSWLTADLLLVKHFSARWVPYINEFLRLMVFLAIAFTLAELRNALETQRHLARTDVLTGVANRRSFFELATGEINRSSRFKRSFSLVYLDLDNFKNINDTYGHNTGDLLLRLVAETIKRNIRTVDMLARLGGDEFVVLLPETEAALAYAVSQRLQASLAHMMQQNGWQVTCSFGVVTFSKAPESVDQVLAEADFLMYSAKHNGKNQIRCKIMP